MSGLRLASVACLLLVLGVATQNAEDRGVGIARQEKQDSVINHVRALIEEDEEEEHLDDFEEDFEECEHSCEVCEQRKCRNLWLELPRGRHLTIAELTWSQNVCIVLLLFLLSIFTAVCSALARIAQRYELRHEEQLLSHSHFGARADHLSMPGTTAVPDYENASPGIVNETLSQQEVVLLEAEAVAARPKEFGSACSKHDRDSAHAHAVLHRGFAFYATTAPKEQDAESPAHETLLNVLRGVPSRHYYQRLLHACSAELMGLGFVAIFVWIAEISGFFKEAAVGEKGRWGPQTPEQAKKTFEDVHFAVFIGVLMYFYIVFRAIRHAVHRFDCFVAAELDLAVSRHPLADQSQLPIGHRCTPKFKRESTKLYPQLRKAFISWIRVNIDRFDEYGIGSPLLDSRVFEASGDDFPFAVYLRLSLDNLFEHLLEINLSSWVTIIAIYAIEALLARLAELDVPAISLGVATLFNMIIAAMIAAARYELNSFIRDYTQICHSGTRQHWCLKQMPRFLQAATLYIVIQFSRFCIDTIVDTRHQMQRYRGQTSYTGWVFLQLANFLLHFGLISTIFPEVTLQLALPPVIGTKSVSLVAELSLLYANIIHRMRPMHAAQETSGHTA